MTLLYMWVEDELIKTNITAQNLIVKLYSLVQIYKF